MPEHTLDQETVKFGLLMESAQAHQKLAEAHLDDLRLHTRGLDDVVRTEIRRTLVEELQTVTQESARVTRALREMHQAAQVRGVLWNLGIAVLCTAIPSAFAHWMLPSATELATLRDHRDALARAVADLERRGGRVEWRSCGSRGRLCVRVDRSAPAYGDQADYVVVKGY